MSRARQWALQVKQAGYLMQDTPDATIHPPMDAQRAAEEMLWRTVPTQYASQVIASDPLLSFQDKVRLNQAVWHASTRSDPQQQHIRMSDLLPAIAGAGLGYLGAAVASPLFSLNPQEKRLAGIGAAALGAVLNTYGR